MRLSVRIAFVTALVVGFGLSPTAHAAVGGGCHSQASGAGTQGTGASVDVSKCQMNPTTLRVEPGATVTFVNGDNLPHNIFGLGWGIDLLNPEGSYTHRFDAAGVYPYACTLHPGMVGAVVAGDGGLGVAVASATPAAATSSDSGTNGPIVAALLGVGAVGLVAAAAFGLNRRRRPTRSLSANEA